MNQQIASWRLLGRLIAYAPRIYALDALLWLGIMGLFPVLTGLIVRAFFTMLEGGAATTRGVGSWIMVLLLAAVANIVVIVLGRFTKTQYRFVVRSLLYHNLLQGVLARPGAEALQRSDGSPIAPGEAISTFRDDVEEIEDTVVGASELACQGVFAVIALGVLLSVNVTVTLLVFLPLLAIMAIVRQLEARIKTTRRAGRAATEQVTGAVGEIFGAVQAIKVAGAEQAVLQHLRRANATRQRAMIADQLLTAGIQAVFLNIVQIGAGLILLVIALSAGQEAATLSVGDVALFIYFLSFIGDFLGFFGTMAAFYRQSEVSFERMAALLPGATPTAAVAASPLALKPLVGRQPPLPTVEQPRPTASDTLRELQATGLTYRYADTGGGITNVDLLIRAGEFVVITGRIGSGKTTLLRVLQGLLPAQAGTMSWNGMRVGAPAAFFVPPRSAYTPQASRLVSAPLRDNLLLGLAADEAAITQALYLAVFERDVAELSDGLATLVGAKGIRLSGGQRQRAAAARMLIRRSNLLIVDDLSSALDVETERVLWERLRLGSGVGDRGTGIGKTEALTSHLHPLTVLAVSHRREVLRRADRIIVLAHGHVVARGGLTDLLKTSNELRQIWQGSVGTSERRNEGA
ncbi:MAG: ABC transporter ATP-binding protein/permease [Chloroflexales bacterium]|nr:ABC transporter ATP-binding protein/permease [Chloroflexales bacterium]